MDLHWRAPRSVLGTVLAALAVVATAIATFGVGTADASPTCTIYWTGKTSTGWGTATNWSLINGGGSAGHVPGVSDYVCMSTSASNIAVDLKSSTTTTIAGISWPRTGTLAPQLGS